MKTTCTLIIVLLHLFCSAQTSSTTKKLRFQSLNQIGFVSSQAGAEPIVQSINGIRYKTFFVGAGIGLDYYKKRSIPLFLDIRKNILNKANTPFIYIDGGYHSMWVKEEPEEWINKGYKGGLYYDAGVGYAFPVFTSSAFTVSFGYSSKEMTEERNRYTWRSAWPQGDDFETLQYKLRRYSFKMGLAL